MVEQTRTLGFTTAFALGLGTMIAAGIFSLSGTAVAAVGSSAVVAFVIAAAIAGVTAAAYSEFASIYSQSGGGYLFTSRTLDHDLLVYAEGVMLFLGYSGTTAFYLATMGHWVHAFVYPFPTWATAGGTALLLGALNARGTEESGAFQILVTGAKVAVLLAFIGGALSFVGPTQGFETFAANFSSDTPGILRIASLAFITFFGFSAIAASAGEIKDPTRTVPRAIAASILTVTLLYTLVIVAMVNSPVPAEVVAEQGETAMGLVAEAFLGPVGRHLIVAGAIFSMVSASNASILAASRIGYLMGREGRAARRFHRIHRDWGTPHWGVGACTVTIIALVVTFTGLFPAEGSALMGLHLGLPALTGFANTNLLIPLSVVNVALIVSRRRFPDLDRPFRVPLTPVLPVVGIVANLGLLVSLPPVGVATGLVGLVVALAAYAAWGGGLPVDELMHPVTEGEATTPAAHEGGGQDPSGAYRVVVPVARAEDAPRLVHLAGELGDYISKRVEIHVVHIQGVPEQIPSDAVDPGEVQDRVEKLRDHLSTMAGDIRVEGYVSRDIAFTILERARDLNASLVLMGAPEDHPEVVETVERQAPCDVAYAFGFTPETSFDVVNVGAGAGPNHRALLPLLDAMGARGSEIHVIRVDPHVGGSSESVQVTLNGLPNTETIEVNNVQEQSVAKGLVQGARRNGGPLFIGASRDQLFKRWLFGSTPDRTIELAEEAGVPVIVYRGPATVSGHLGEAGFVAYRFLRGVLGR